MKSTMAVLFHGQQGGCPGGQLQRTRTTAEPSRVGGWPSPKDDCGSLNGTYVNRRRIESHRLVDGDELQVGKYKLAYLSR